MKTIEGRPALFLILTGLLVFGAHAPKAGLHLDDHAFHRTLSGADWPEIRERTLKYVPGRNLYILYYAGLYRILGPEPSRLHLFGVGLDILNALLAASLLVRLGGSLGWSLLFAGLFLVYPNHGETHFWTAAVGMNLLSTTFLLAACRLAAAQSLNAVVRWAACLGLLALAVFDYDQSVLMWLPIAVYAVWLCPDSGLPRAWALSFAGAGIVLDAAHAFLRAYSPHSEGGRPVVRLGQVGQRAWEALLSSAVPLRKFPIWESLQSWAGGPEATTAMVLALAGTWAWLSRRLGVPEAHEPKSEGPGLGRIAAFGLLWMLCAYAPNFFWYLSPRHNYLPSFGFLLALTAVALTLSRELGLAVRRGLAAAVFLVFGALRGRRDRRRLRLAPFGRTPRALHRSGPGPAPGKARQHFPAGRPGFGGPGPGLQPDQRTPPAVLEQNRNPGRARGHDFDPGADRGLLPEPAFDVRPGHALLASL